MVNIHVISFDGLNRCGKGTQIKKLGAYIQSKGTPTVIMRGDGSRKGEGLDDDPYSEWWQKIQPHLRETDDNGSFRREYWDLAAERLNKELYEMYHFTFPKMLEETQRSHGYILLDRSIISRLFVERRDDSTLTLDRLMEFKDSADIEEQIILPDLAFILHCSQDALLERNEIISDHPDKYQFRKKIITEYYESFIDTVRNLNTDKIHLVHLDGNKAPELIFDDVTSFHGRMEYHGLPFKTKEVEKYVQF